MKIFKFILIFIFMTIVTWGLLPKSAVDDETVEEAIARLITAHNDDETAHLATGQSLQSHKASEIIDHVAGSVVEDKLANGSVTTNKLTSNQIIGKDFRTASGVGSGTSGVKFTSSGIEMWDGTDKKVDIPTSGNPTFSGIILAREMHFLRSYFYTSFDSLDRWLQAGTGSVTLSLAPLVINSGATANNIKYIYGEDYTGEYVNTETKDINFETVLKAVNTTDAEYVFGINMVAGEPDNSNLPNGIAFEIKTNKVYAVKYRDDGTRDATEIAATTPSGYHSYRVEVLHGVSIKYYIDGVLKHTYTTNLPAISPAYIFGYSVKTLGNASKWLYIANLSIETPFD